MATFKDLKSLFKHIEKDIQSGMKDVGKEAKKVAQRHVDTDVYAQYTPKKYERSYQLRDSIDAFEANGKQGEYAVIIQHDTGEITSSRLPTYNHYSKTPGNYDPDVSDFYMEWVHDGASGNAFGYGAWMLPRPYMKNAFKEIDMSKVHIKTLKDSLKSKGYEIE